MNTNLTRLPRWEGRLVEYFGHCAKIKFDRGSFDCVRFVAGAVYEITGTDLSVAFKDMYKDDLDAMRIVHKAGADGFFKLVNEVCLNAGLTLTKWPLIRRGDVVAFKSTEENKWAGGLGICDGAHAVTVSPGKIGLTSISMNDTRAGWAIPYPYRYV